MGGTKCPTITSRRRRARLVVACCEDVLGSVGVVWLSAELDPLVARCSRRGPGTTGAVHDGRAIWRMAWFHGAGLVAQGTAATCSGRRGSGVTTACLACNICAGAERLFDIAPGGGGTATCTRDGPGKAAKGGLAGDLDIDLALVGTVTPARADSGLFWPGLGN